jgi:hypothetical protein
MSSAPFHHVDGASWSWDLGYESYMAALSPVGVSYFVWMPGPAGGEGMAGFQSLDALLANGPLHDMPPEIHGAIRAAIERLREAPSARLTWLVELAADVRGRLTYVSASIDGDVVALAELRRDARTITLFEGTLAPGPHTLAAHIRLSLQDPAHAGHVALEHSAALAADVATIVTSTLDAAQAISTVESVENRSS